MKHLRIFLALMLVAALLTACGGNAAPTTVPTTAPTTAPTTEPTTVPTEAPTEPAVELEPIVNIYFDEPEGFTVVTAGETMSILAGPDGDGTSITMLILATPMDLSELTEENFAEALGLLGEGAEAPKLNALDTLEIDGYPACLMDYNMTTSGISAHFQAYMITDGSITITLIFTDATADGAWAEEFAASVASINVLVDGEYVPVDTDELELYDLECGVSMYAKAGLEKLDVDGFDAILADDYCTVMVIRDNKADYGLYGMTVEEYASFYVDGEVITGFATDACGNVATSFLSEGDDGYTYFYYAVAKEVGDNFYLIQCACDQENAVAMAMEFAQWCATFAENP